MKGSKRGTSHRLPDRPLCYNDAVANDSSSDAGLVGPAPDPGAIRFVLCDLDGVVWLRRVAIPGSADAIARLRATGRRVLFVTNNSMSRVADQEAALAAIGIPAIGDVVTSAQAAAHLVEPGETVLVCADAGVVEAVGARGADVVHDGDADVVIVGLHQDFDYDRMQAANRAIRHGARFVATNDDATFPTPDGPIPGAGALVAAVATASGVQPRIAGKPYLPMATLVAERCGPTFAPEAAIVVGDRFSTDGRFAQALGSPFALVRSGVTPPDAEPGGHVAIDGPDLAAIADVIVGA